MPFWTYILECSDGSYYVGHTDDIDARLAQHNHGSGSGYTALRRPVTLRWAGESPTRDAAFAFERQLKGWSRAKKEAVIAGRWDALPELAKPRGPGTGQPDTGSLRPGNNGAATVPESAA